MHFFYRSKIIDIVIFAIYCIPVVFNYEFVAFQHCALCGPQWRVRNPKEEEKGQHLFILKVDVKT